MKTVCLIAGLTALCTQTIYSQVSSGGSPPSFSITATVKSVGEVEAFHVKAPDLPLLKNQDNQEAEKGGMYRVGVNLPIALNPQNSGTWETLPNGDKIWRLRIVSKNAKALGVYYSEQIRLPKQTKLFVYNKSLNQVIGAYTSELNNQVNTIYANEMIQGDELVLEYFAPASVTKQPVIEIEEVVYFYRGAEDYVGRFMNQKNGGNTEKAQSCEVNVACSEGNGWQDEVDATVHYTFSSGGSTYVCSGAMIVNTAGDCKPYLLTANHCGEKTTSSAFNSNVWYFKYENPNCSPGTTSQYQQPSTTMTGAIFRASAKNGSHQATGSQVYGSDFTLVELNTQPPSNYQVFYAGWDRRNIAATSGKGIHHPAGHDKKISTYTSSLQSSTYNGGLASAHWEVVWAPTANGHGVTEGGSSGSPLFNQNHRIIGDLSGGSSFCTSPYSSDLYGKIYNSWDLLSSNSNGQLAAWLDPGNTGLQFIDGMRPPCSSPSPATCTATISSFPYSEGFESGIGQWSQETSDNLDWTNQSGGTPSGSTGPSSAFQGSKYMYIEASSPNYPSKSAQLLSPCFNLSGINGLVLTFAYHMYGAAMGSLSVDVSDDNGASWTLGIWSVSGNQTNAWKNASVDLSAYSGSTIKIRLSGLTGTGYTSDICIDAMSITAAPIAGTTYCTPAPTNGTGDGDYVGGVAIGTINNLDNGGTNTASYKDYTATYSTDLFKGVNQSLTIVEGGYTPDRYAAWIDYNQDGDFNDAGEKLGEFTGSTIGSSHQIAFNVPAGAILGTTRMRVRCLYNGNANGVDPCINGDYGETEDYSVEIKTASAPLVYCTPNPTNGTTDGDYIGGVALGSISNLNNGGTGTAAYKNYTAYSTGLNRGSNQSLTIVEGGYTPDRYAAWIDYNQDGDFNDAGEKLGEYTGNVVGSSHTISFTVPTGAVLGSTRMRVRCLYNGNANGVDPCTNGDYGETEDYTVVIADGNKQLQLNSISSAGDLQVFPNPTSKELFVQFNSTEEIEIGIELMDLTGKSIYSEITDVKAGLFRQELSLEGKAAGVYLLVIDFPNERVTKRIVLK